MCQTLESVLQGVGAEPPCTKHDVILKSQFFFRLGGWARGPSCGATAGREAGLQTRAPVPSPRPRAQDEIEPKHAQENTQGDRPVGSLRKKVGGQIYPGRHKF